MHSKILYNHDEFSAAAIIDYSSEELMKNLIGKALIVAHPP